MSLNPPPTRVPPEFSQDPNVIRFMDELLRSIYLIWSGIEVNVGFYGTDQVTQASALTTALASLTHTSPGTPDYAIQNLTTTSPFGFVTQDEGNTVLSVILNLQTRVNELEAAIDSSTGVGVIT